MDVSAIAGELGIELRSSRPATTGQGRTYFGVSSDGGQVVVKWSAEQSWCSHLPTAITYADALIERGYPAARTLAHGPAGGGYGWVQERLAGIPATGGLNGPQLDEVTDAIELQADARLAAHDPLVNGWTWVSAVVFDDEAGWWKTARASGAGAAEMWDTVQAWLHEVPRALLRMDDVHLDMNFTDYGTVHLIWVTLSGQPPGHEDSGWPDRMTTDI